MVVLVVFVANAAITLWVKDIVEMILAHIVSYIYRLQY